MSAENLPERLDLTAEEIAKVLRERERRQAIADYLNPPPPPPEPTPAEIQYREAVDWLLLKLARLEMDKLTGTKDAGYLADYILYLSYRNGLILQQTASAPSDVPPAKSRPKHRPPGDPLIRARHYRTSTAIHKEIVRRLSLDLPVSPPHGAELTALLVDLKRRITGTRQGREKALCHVVEHLPKRYDHPKLATRNYKAICRWFLIQDLAAFIFGEFLRRGGILAFSKGRGIYLPSFSLARDKKPTRRRPRQARPLTLTTPDRLP